MLQGVRAAIIEKPAIIERMEPPLDAKILILPADAASGRRWAEMLRQPGSDVWASAEEMPRDSQPEVIVTDRDLSGTRWAGQSPAEPAAEVSAVVRIGPEGPAEVWLPADVTARELRLACRLLAQIVRLRRREQSADELRRRLSQQALTDPLTGLPNRRAWQQALGERLAMAADSGQSDRQRLCLAIFDLDHFKRINDAHGHAAGDEVLRSAGRAIRDGLRQDDFVARLGGDEFALLLWVPDEATALAVVDGVRTALPSRLTEAGIHALSASAGYYLSPFAESSEPLPSAEHFYAAADAALHGAKRQGRDRTVQG